MRKLLVIDDDIYFVKSIKRIVRTIGDYEAEEIQNIKSVGSDAFLKQYDAVLLDLNMPKPDGKECLEIIKRTSPSVPVIIITGENSADTAVSYLRMGVYDYLTKPVDINRLAAALENLFRLRSLEEELSSVTDHLLNNELKNPQHFSAIITKDESMLRCFRYIEAIAKTDKPILIIGETGTGKELAAEAVHKSSGRTGEYIAIDVSGVDDNSFSDTLFGHVRGAFTGAEKNRTGLLESASGGTIFLDEIGDLQEASQIKLLRLLQTGFYYPLGSDTPKTCSARIITAVNRPPEELLGRGFRNDLYYRLSTYKIEIAPLKNRKADLELLARHFYDKASAELNITEPIDEKVFSALGSYDFPGNVRELKSIIDESVLLAGLGTPFYENVLKRLGAGLAPEQPGTGLGLMDVFGRIPTIQEVTERLISEALKESGGSQKKAAELTGLSRQAFNRRLNIMKKR